ERLAHLSQNAFGNPDSVARVAYVLKQHDELIASQPRDGIGAGLAGAKAARTGDGIFATHARSQTLPELTDERVTSVMSHAVVNDLQIIEIEKQDRGLALGVASPLRDRLLQPVHEDGAVRQLRERIMSSVEVQHLLCFFVVRNVSRIN